MVPASRPVSQRSGHVCPSLANQPCLHLRKSSFCLLQSGLCLNVPRVGKVETGKPRPLQGAFISSPSSALSPACALPPAMAPGCHWSFLSPVGHLRLSDFNKQASSHLCSRLPYFGKTFRFPLSKRAACGLKRLKRVASRGSLLPRTAVANF